MNKQTFEDLRIWQSSHQIVLKVYRLCASFPSEEKFALVDQLKRAAASIPANIAEGYGRRTNKDFVQFLHIALGSAEETHYHLILSRDLRYISEECFSEIVDELVILKKQLIAFINKINTQLA
jgi:four helix bundle protein